MIGRASPRATARRLARSVGLASVIAASAFLTQGMARPAPVQAAFPGAAGLIAYQVNDSIDSQIWIMNPDGTGKKQLTSIGNNVNPSWSPDGTHIAFVSTRDTYGEIYVMNANGTNQTRITTDGQNTWPTWSPAGDKIAYNHYGPSYDVWVMDANGSNQVNLTNDPSEDLQPAWRPGTSTIAFQTNRDGDREIYAIQSNGTGLIDLSKAHATEESDPDWSPDGSKLVFARAGDIATMLADGTGVQVLASGHGDMFPAWSPDGARIAFTSHRDVNDEIYVMDANGANPKRLTNNGGLGSTLPEDWFPDWQPVAVALSPLALAFGTVKIGTPSVGKVVTLQMGITPGTVSGVTITGLYAPNFDLLGQTCTAAPIPARGSCTATVRFDPITEGSKSASLSFTVVGVGTRSVALSGLARAFLWDATRSAGPSYTWNYGVGLARTVSGSATYLHAIYTTDRISGGWANDTTRKAGAYYIRSSNAGATWTTPKRLNPTTQQGARVSIASSGTYVYTAWVSVTKWIAYSGTAPRILYFRRNTNSGSSTAWSATLRLTSTTGRVDYPKIAASGAYVYVTYTDSVTGLIRLAVSADRGATWKTYTVGSTTRTSSSGREGFPVVAAAGANVGVAWVSNPSANVTVRVSTTHGTSWGTAVALGATASTPSVAAVGTRFAVAWTGTRAMYRTWNAGTWAAAASLPPTDGYATEQQQDPAIALLGTGGIALVYTACITDCSFSDVGVLANGDLILRTSLNGGTTWAPSDVVTTHTGTHRMNDAPTLLWPSTTKPYVLWNGWTEESLYYKLYFRTAL